LVPKLLENGLGLAIALADHLLEATAGTAA